MIEFASYDAFSLDDPRRLISAVVDLGVHWAADGKRWPCWALRYLQDTGEVYAEALGQPRGRHSVRLLGTYPADEVGESLPYMRRPRWYATLDDVVLKGWADEPHRDLSWVTGRLERAAAGAVSGS